MKLKNIIVEDFCNYKHPAMFLITAECDWKCCRENGLNISICQNSSLASAPTKDIPDDVIYSTFIQNDITDAIVVGGLEPFLQFDELINLIKLFRDNGEECDFVIYTGYNPQEIHHEVSKLSKYKNIIIKYGRYIPSSPSRYDDVLGVKLASDNQFARRIS